MTNTEYNRMKFFQKDNSIVPDRQHIAPKETADTNIITSNLPETPEMAAEQWFLKHYQTSMPDELKRLFRHLSSLEVKKLKIGEHILDQGEQDNIQNQLRLSQTKLRNLSQAIESLNEQKKWLYKYEQLNSVLNKCKQAYFQINKEYNIRLNDIQSLERFEDYEAILSNYEHIKLFKEDHERLLSELNATQKEINNLQKEFDKARTESENRKNQYSECLQNLFQQQSRIAEAHRTEERIAYLDARIQEIQDTLSDRNTRLNDLQQTANEQLNDLEKTRHAESELRSQIQNMGRLQRMTEKGDVLLAKLQFLQNQNNRKEQLKILLEDAIKKQTEQNEKLNKLFVKSQEIDAQINTLQSELAVHQKSIVGMNSYMLQQRAMTLKSQKEQLTNAERLWKQITKTFLLIEDKKQEVTRIQLHIENLKSNIKQLQPEVSGLEKQNEELKYAYTLSKSQDVMQMRKDLREGVNCSVCGATHHPYHADSFIEQSKLIGEIKTEFNQINNELKNKTFLLDEQKKELAKEEGKLEIACQALIIYKELQQENITGWKQFSSLDRSLNECTTNANYEARLIMIRQLVEKTGIDAEKAQKDLDNFNFHQSNINTLNEKLSAKEMEKNDLTIRLNEVNTGCQVLAYKVEHLQQSYSRVNSNYSRLYEEIDQMMCISNWLKVWSENPENLYIYIQKQMELDNSLKEQLQQNKTSEIQQSGTLRLTQQTIQELERERQNLFDEMERLTENRKQQSNHLANMLKATNAEAYNQQLLNALTAAETEKEEAELTCHSLKEILSIQTGRLQQLKENNEQLEHLIAKESSAIDLWIKSYNTQHSPIQYADIDKTFRSNINWNELRKTARKLDVKNSVSYMRVEDAQLALAAHQADTSSPRPDKDNQTAFLNAEIAKLENEQNILMMRIASLQSRLEAHKASIRELAAIENEIISQ